MFTSFRRQFFAVLAGLSLSASAHAATFIVHSTPPNSAGTNSGNARAAGSGGYTVKVTVTPVAIVAPTSCPWGYNYDVDYTYSITYSGNVPANANMYDLRMAFNCGSQNFETGGKLPKTISTTTQSGSGRTTNNQWTNNKDCATANATSQGCLAGISTLTISGPDMPAQTLSRPTNSTTLPVTLVSFDGRKTDGGVFLAWRTANEEAGDRYFVERSTDGENWAAVAMVASAGKGDYQYTDMAPQPGTSYYRLRNVDAKGEVTYSRILGVKMATEETQIALFPNPSNGETVRVSGIQIPSDWTYAISNGTTQVAHQAHLTGLDISLPQLPAGLYFIRFTNQKTAETKVLKMVRQ